MMVIKTNPPLDSSCDCSLWTAVAEMAGGMSSFGGRHLVTVAGTEDEGAWSRGLGPALDPAVAICCCLLPPSSGGCDAKTSVGMAELNDAVAASPKSDMVKGQSSTY